MFEFLANFFYITLYQPLFNLLIFLYDYLSWNDFGIAIIFLTIIIRIILIPLSIKAVKSQKKLQELQPKIQEIQKKNKGNKEQEAKEMLEIYKREKINPFSSIFLALVQLPILIALYKVFWEGLNPEKLSVLYPMVANPVAINTFFLGIMDLSKPNIILAVIAGITQFFQAKMLMPNTSKKESGAAADISQMMQKQMVYFFPVLTVVMLLGLPSALGLYWTVGGLFTVAQQKIFLKK